MAVGDGESLEQALSRIAGLTVRGRQRQRSPRQASQLSTRQQIELRSEWCIAELRPRMYIGDSVSSTNQCALVNATLRARIQRIMRHQFISIDPDHLYAAP